MFTDFCVYPFEDQKKIESTFLSSASQFPEEHCFLQDSQPSPICPSGNSNLYMKMSMVLWWNDFERGKPKHFYFVHHESHMDWPGSKPGAPRWEASVQPPELF